MRISDWSSDVCSSDLRGLEGCGPRQRDRRGPVTRTRGIATAAFAQKILHDPVLGAVKADDGEPAAGAQQPLGGGKTRDQLVELAVDVDADRLKALGRGIQIGRASCREQGSKYV